MQSLFPPNTPPSHVPPVHYPHTVDVEVINSHFHPRGTDEDQDGRAEMLIPLEAEAYAISFCMGNTVPPLTTSALAMAKRLQWERIIPEKKPLQLKIGGLMTEHTDPDDIVAGYDQPKGKVALDYMKMFVRAASNAHGADVDDMCKIIPVLKAMTNTRFTHRKHPMTLAIHMERKYDLFGRRISILERERASVERDLSYLFIEVPEAKIVVCHVSLAYTVEIIRYLRARGCNIWGELGPHYSDLTCDDLFEAPDGGTKFDTKDFCLPIFKTELDRQAVHAAMISGEDCWIHGRDNACWPDEPIGKIGGKTDKEGYTLGGQTDYPAANVSYVIEKFAEAGRMRHLRGYLSGNTRDAYGLSEPVSTQRFRKEDWIVPKVLERETPHGRLRARVAAGGQARKYRPE